MKPQYPDLDRGSHHLFRFDVSMLNVLANSTVVVISTDAYTHKRQARCPDRTIPLPKSFNNTPSVQASTSTMTSRTTRHARAEFPVSGVDNKPATTISRAGFSCWLRAMTVVWMGRGETKMEVATTHFNHAPRSKASGTLFFL
jgi:hypothetical protein